MNETIETVEVVETIEMVEMVETVETVVYRKPTYGLEIEDSTMVRDMIFRDEKKWTRKTKIGIGSDSR